MCNGTWTGVVSECVQRWELLQLSGCSVQLSEIYFQEVFKNRKALFICLKKRYNRFRRTGRCSRDQKEQTECMGLGLDGMQKMNGAINVDFMTEEEIHQKLEAGYKDMESGKVREASIV